MEFTWSERKRSVNLKQHGIDFLDAVAVFEGLTFTYEDDRFSYREQRFITLGCSPAFLSQSSIRRPKMKSASSRSAKRPAAKRSSSSMQSKTDWAKLKAGGRVTVAPDHPEVEVRHVVRGIVRRRLKP